MSFADLLTEDVLIPKCTMKCFIQMLVRFTISNTNNFKFTAFNIQSIISVISNSEVSLQLFILEKFLFYTF